MSSKKYILWDNDGVLVETEKWYYEAGKKALAEISIELEWDRYMEIMVQGSSVFDLAREQGMPQDKIEYHRARRDDFYQEFIQTKDIEIPGVEKVLSRLSDSFKMGIITSSRREDFDLIHNHRPLVKYMDFVLASGEYPRGKPHPDPYLAGMERFDATREEVIVVEDSQRGLTSALAAGLDCIIMHNEFTQSQDFTGALARLDTIQELPEFLSTL